MKDGFWPAVQTSITDKQRLQDQRDGEVWCDVADYYWLSGDLDSAQAYYEMAVEKTPYDTLAIFGVARTMDAKGHFDMAVEFLVDQSRRRDNKNYLEMAVELAQKRGLQEHAADAAKNLDERSRYSQGLWTALADNPHLKEILRHLWRKGMLVVVNIADAFQRAGKVDAVLCAHEVHLEMCLAHSDEEDWIVLTRMVRAVKDMGALGEAITCFERLLSVSPGVDSIYHVSKELLTTLVRDRRGADAESLLARISRMPVSDSMADYRLKELCRDLEEAFQEVGLHDAAERARAIAHGDANTLEVVRRVVSDDVAEDHQQCGSGSFFCPGCKEPIESSWLVCPACEFDLKALVCDCGQKLESHWKVCPACRRRVGRR